jgi:hypothetical protein
MDIIGLAGMGFHSLPAGADCQSRAVAWALVSVATSTTSYIPVT